MLQLLVFGIGVQTSILYKEFLDKQKEKIIKAAMSIGEGDPSEIGFICRSMVSASMPHSKIAGLQYKRENNNWENKNEKHKL